MLGTIKKEILPKMYLNIKDGAVVRRTQAGEERYSYVEGTLHDILLRERTFRGETVPYWYIELRDQDSGEIYSLGFSYTNNTYKSIILSLASDDTLTADSLVRIEPYVKNGYDKVVVSTNGKKLDWIVSTLPPIEESVVCGRKIKNDTKRMEYIHSLTDDLSQRALGKQIYN